MNDVQRLKARVVQIAKMGAVVIGLTVIARLFLPMWQKELNGLLLGEVGGTYVVYSMIRHGHVGGELAGRSLYISGMLGYLTRFMVVLAGMIVAVKVPIFNPYLTLVGYMLGFALVIIGMAGFVKKP